MTWLLTTFQQWLLFASTILLVGCAAWQVLVAPRALRALPPERGQSLRGIEGRVARLAVTSALLAGCAWFLRGVVQVMGFRDPFVPLWDDVAFLLHETTWGTVWMAQGVIVILLTVAFIVAGRRSRRADATPGTEGLDARATGWWWLASLLVLGLVCTLALSSHAMGVDPGRALAVGADGLHTLAAGTWIGSLSVILVAGRGPSRDPAPLAVFAAQIRSFSPVALVSGLVLVGMGVALSWTHLQAVSDLWVYPYGRILSGKIALALVIFGFGFWNWRRGVPDVESSNGAAILRRRAAFEVALATVVLLLTAILVHSTKP